MATHKQPKIVVVGGGTGSPASLRGLRPYTDQISAIVTMFDSGGSSGILSSEFGYPPLGDLRRCLLALTDANEITEALRPLVEFRFDPDSSLSGHSLGNLLMAALTSVRCGIQEAVDEMAHLLRIRGQVLPVTLERADLCAELEDGQVLVGESTIDLRGEKVPRINRVFLSQTVPANPRAVQAILEADAVILGPGDLYTSVIPNLLAEGIPEAIAQSSAKVVYVCNLMTKLGETDDFTASDFVAEVLRYLNGPHLDWVLVNSKPVPADVLMRYREEGANPVACDAPLQLPNIRWHANGFAQITEERKMRHSAEELATAILRILSTDSHKAVASAGAHVVAH